jgi:hypothetical protein
MSNDIVVHPRFARRELNPWTLASFAAHAGMLLLFHLLPPRSAALSFSDADRESRLAKFVRLQRMTAPEPMPSWVRPGGTAANEPRTEEKPAPAGTRGEDPARTPDPRRGTRRTSTSTSTSTDPLPARDALPDTRGIIDMLQQSAWQVRAAHFDARSAAALSAEGALAALFGGQLATGRGGEGMIGTGRGAGAAPFGTIDGHGLRTFAAAGGGSRGSRYGTGADTLKGRAAKVPTIRLAPATEVRGALSKETIRRVLQRHVNEVRYCYEEGLRARPDLQGRVAIRFVVRPDGAVQLATKASSDLGDAEVEQCIAGVVRRLQFPAPEGGGMVFVTYPFMLQRAE